MSEESKPGVRYLMIWRNKYLTMESETIEEVIRELRHAGNRLEEIMATGKVDVEMEGAEEDYIFLSTSDPVVAEKYNFLEEDDSDDYNELDDEYDTDIELADDAPRDADDDY